MRLQRSPFRVPVSALLILLGATATASASEPDEAPLVAPIHVDDAGLPRPGLTPGDRLASAKTKALCAESTEPKHPSAALCDAAFARYGIPAERRFQYACRYLIPLSIGGAGTERNVWPQVEAEAQLKDALDRDLTRRVCAEEVTLAVAQRDVAYDWVEAYHRYLVPNDPPPVILPPHEAAPHVRSRPDGAYVMQNDNGGGMPPGGPGMYPDYPPQSAPSSSAGGGDGSQPQDNRRNPQGNGQRNVGRPGQLPSGAVRQPPPGILVPPPRARPAPLLRAQRPLVPHGRPIARANPGFRRPVSP